MDCKSLRITVSFTVEGNPALREQMRGMLPTFLTQLNNPEVQNLVTNPQALSAMMQIQQGMRQLAQVAPSFASTLVASVHISPTTTDQWNICYLVSASAHYLQH